MNEIIAALILACTNLARVDVSWDREKSKCVQRVSTCVADVINSGFGDRERTVKILNQCSKEVHL